MTNDTLKITISKEFEQFIIPLSSEEYTQLEANILEEGCRDPLVVWSHKGKNVLLDGHNRFGICERNNLSYRLTVREFEGFE